MEVQKGKYQHFKGEFAEVIGEAKNSETGEMYVAYYHTEKETGKMVLWVRPKKMFFEDVELEGKNVPRFKFIRPE